MTDISKMSDREKSVLLARAMGWKIYEFTHVMFYPLGYDPSNRISNLYDPAYMALAWRVLNWAYNNVVVKSQEEYLDIGQQWEQWFITNIELGEEKAQRHWLDKIIELAIEAGVVEALP